MSYKPTFDSSTLHYAEKALNWLSGENDQIDIARLNRALVELNVWKNNPTDPEFDKLIQKVSELEGYKRDITLGKWTSPEKEDPRHDGINLLRYLFGLLCLSKVIESICLADKVYYLASTGNSGFRLSDFASKLLVDKKIWHTVTGSQDSMKSYAEWVYKGPIATNKDLQNKISDFANTALTRPFGILCGHLYDTSAGNITPWTNDTFIPTDGFPSFLSWDELAKLIPPSPISPSFAELSSTQRMYKYIINGIYYAYICEVEKLDYVVNVVRSPFLFALQFISPSTEKDRLNRVLALLTTLREDSVREELPIQIEKQIDFSHLIMASVLLEAKTAKDIMPAALRIRRKLAGLRDIIKKQGLTNHLLAEVKSIVQKTKSESSAEVSVELPINIVKLGIKIPASSFMGFLNLRKRPFLKGIEVVANRYENIYSLGEQLQFLIEREKD